MVLKDFNNKGIGTLLVSESDKLLIKKGRQQKEVLKPIKNVALDFWKEQLEGSSPEDYVFSSNFKEKQLSFI